MESIIKEKSEFKYPYLKQMGDTIVLFIAKDQGVAVNQKELGDFSTNWVENNFEYFNGEITLKN